MLIFALVCAGGVVAAAGPGAHDKPVGLGRLTPITEQSKVPGDCIPPSERARLAAALADYERKYGPLSQGGGDSPVLYPFHPQAGNLWHDIGVFNFVDLDPNPGSVQSWDCSQWSYDGHNGHDVIIRSFAEQAVGVPVFAALDGTVIFAHDGEDDMNQGCFGDANAVVLDNGNGRQTYYWHMKKGSVAVQFGDGVVAGQQIGLVGSSGCSDAPHLHFESHQDDAVYEPYAGDCRPGASGWIHQPALPPDNTLYDFGVTATDLDNVPGWPQPYPRDAQIELGDEYTYFWVLGGSMPLGATWEFRWYRPDGGLSADTGEVPFNNPSPYAGFIFWFRSFVDEMHTIKGTWTLSLLLDGKEVVHAPVEVVKKRNPGFNRPPQPIGAHFDPAEADEGDVIFCRVDADPVLEDLDWDVLRFHYVWTVDGTVVRDLVSGGEADAIPAEWVQAGSKVACSVTPSDGKADGQEVKISTTVLGGTCEADCDGSGGLDLFDFLCFVNLFNTGNPSADCDVSGALDFFDFLCFTNRFNEGC